MADTYTLRLQNFRSIRDATIEIAPLTVIYGPNGSGKSSLIYGLLTLKNFLSNPNQNVSGLFSYPSISLGGLQEVAHQHDADAGVSLSIGVSNPNELSTTYTLKLAQSGGEATIAFDTPDGWEVEPWPDTIEALMSIPYSGGKGSEYHITQPFDEEDIHLGVLEWNGLTLSARTRREYDNGIYGTRQLNERTNLPMELARLTGFVPLRRGFSQPAYGLVSVTPALTTEDEVASLLAMPPERFQQYEVSKHTERIVSRRVQPQSLIGTSTFTIDTIPLDGGTPVSIVNEGFGINQLVYLLTVCLHSPFKIVAVEEPEIHLHPTLVRKLAHAMAEIAVKENRRLIVSTHSETFVVALLTQIAAGNVKVDDVSFVLAENRDGESVFAAQKATPDGQLQGGLETFIAAGIEDLAIFLGLDGDEGQGHAL